jgi:ribosomal protein L37AE/L43A
MIPLRIRDLMLMVLHAAIALSIVVGFRKLWVRDLWMLALTLSLYIPMASGIVSAVTMRPGPHRDWVTGLCFALPMLDMALYFALASVILARRLIGPFSGWRDWGAIVCPGLSGLMFGATVLLLARRNLALRPCPGCRRRGLVRSALRSMGGRVRAWYICCLSCDLVAPFDVGNRRGISMRDLGSAAEPGENEPACPTCGQETLRRIPYEFFWCLSCLSRYKRIGRGAWEDAGGSEDDRFYWLWSVQGWLTKQIRRITRRGRSSD